MVSLGDLVYSKYAKSRCSLFQPVSLVFSLNHGPVSSSVPHHETRTKSSLFSETAKMAEDADQVGLGQNTAALFGKIRLSGLVRGFRGPQTRGWPA